MRVLVVNTNCERSPDTIIPIGACCVASSAKNAGYDIHFLDLTFSRSPRTDVINAINKIKPNVIALSVRNIDNCDMLYPKSYMPFMRDLAETCRTVSDSPLVIGGSGVTCIPGPMLAYLGGDYAIVGEGEGSFPALLSTLEEKKDPAGVPGVVSAADENVLLPPVPCHSFSSAPNVDLSEWLDIGKYQRSGAAMPVQTKRGCSFHCSYCLYPKMEGEGIRLRNADEVASDVLLAEISGFRSVEFVDSVFNAPEAHAISCCEAIASKDNRIPLQSLEVNPLYASAGLVQAMNSAGFSAVGCTAESASDDMLESLNKGFGVEQLHQAARQFRKLNATKVWVFMLGGPGETEKTVAETVRFIEKELTPGDLVYITLGIRILPGTELNKTAIKEGLVSHNDDLLWPKFYFSPRLEPERAMSIIAASRFPSANIISISDGNSRLLPLFQKMAHALHISPPYWRLAPQWNRFSRAFRSGWWRD